MRKTQAARVLVSGLIVLALGCDNRRATSPSVGGRSPVLLVCGVTRGDRDRADVLTLAH